MHGNVRRENPRTVRRDLDSARRSLAPSPFLKAYTWLCFLIPALGAFAFLSSCSGDPAPRDPYAGTLVRNPMYSLENLDAAMDDFKAARASGDEAAMDVAWGEMVKHKERLWQDAEQLEKVMGSRVVGLDLMGEDDYE